jgi:hypothetical protein
MRLRQTQSGWVIIKKICRHQGFQIPGSLPIRLTGRVQTGVVIGESRSILHIGFGYAEEKTKGRRHRLRLLLRMLVA